MFNPFVGTASHLVGVAAKAADLVAELGNPGLGFGLFSGQGFRGVVDSVLKIPEPLIGTKQLGFSDIEFDLVSQLRFLLVWRTGEPCPGDVCVGGLCWKSRK